MTSTCIRANSAASAARAVPRRFAPIATRHDVGALDVAEVAEARPQALLCDGLRNKAQKPNSLQFRALLRPHRERPTSRGGPKECDEVAALQLIELHPSNGSYISGH